MMRGFKICAEHQPLFTDGRNIGNLLRCLRTQTFNRVQIGRNKRHRQKAG